MLLGVSSGQWAEPTNRPDADRFDVLHGEQQHRLVDEGVDVLLPLLELGTVALTEGSLEVDAGGVISEVEPDSSSELVLLFEGG